MSPNVRSWIWLAVRVLFLKTPAVWPTAFYLWYFGDKQGFMPKMLTENSKGQQFFVIKPSRYGVGRFTNEQTQKILQLDDAELHVAE